LYKPGFAEVSMDAAYFPHIPPGFINKNFNLVISLDKVMEI
jgi:hypothetical protein